MLPPSMFDLESASYALRHRRRPSLRSGRRPQEPEWPRSRGPTPTVPRP
jgi:hypothetical protein